MKNQLNKIMENLLPIIKQLDFSNKNVYGNWLTQQYYIVRHSTPLLALSCGRSIENRDYHIRCISHLSEEKGHDKMLLNDLNKLNFSLNSYPELNSTRAVYQTQYYWIEHVNPTSFLGYILFLETLAVKYGERVSSEAKSGTFLKHHSDADEDHLKSAFSVIEQLSSIEKTLIIENLNEAAYLYSMMLNDISGKHIKLEKAS